MAALGANPRDNWDQGQLAYLIPTASAERFLIKASFETPLSGVPKLMVDGRALEGVQTDGGGRAPGLVRLTPLVN
jgi:hypothetical protein